MVEMTRTSEVKRMKEGKMVVVEMRMVEMRVGQKLEISSKE
jgi:hypothetical protein